MVFVMRRPAFARRHRQSAFIVITNDAPAGTLFSGRYPFMSLGQLSESIKVLNAFLGSFMVCAAPKLSDITTICFMVLMRKICFMFIMYVLPERMKYCPYSRFADISISTFDSPNGIMKCVPDE